MERPDHIWKGVLSQSTAVADEKKRKIIEATIYLMAREGIGAVTFESVGKRLKTTKANIKYHFSDKDQLVFTAIKTVVFNAQAITAKNVEAAASPEAKLNAIIESAYQWYHHFPDHLTVWVLYLYYAHILEPYAEFFIATRAVGQQRMQFLLRALPHSSSPDIDYLGLAEQIQNLMYGQFLGLIGKRKELKNNKKQTKDLIAVLLQANGVRWSNPR